MLATRPRLADRGLGLALAVLAILGAAPAAHPAGTDGGSGSPEPSPTVSLTILERTIAQEKVPQDKATPDPKWFWQTWQVDYRLRFDGPAGLAISPADVSATIEGWVSNSRVPSHAAPRPSSLALTGSTGLAAVVEVIETADEARRCRERATLQVWPASGVDPDHLPPTAPEKAKADPAAPADPRPPLNLTAGDIVRVRLRLVHQHFLYGMYDPLLGRRTMELHLGPASLRDILPLDREHRIAQAINAWSDPPPDRRDARQFVSAPDSLHLEAHIPGNQYYRFPEQPVRYATRMRLRYWYLVAPGTEGVCKARIAQYKDTPTAWKVLSEGGQEECLTVVGRWVHVDRTFRTEAEATTLALDFRIVGADVGELWIDDVSLEPVGAGPDGP